jgi:tRNA(Arg) A34 adenosine deaminase TadA
VIGALVRQKFNSKFIDHAFNVAKDSPSIYQARIAATLVYRNKKIVCTRTNLDKSHPHQVRFCHHPEAIYLHAEKHTILHAIRSKLIHYDDLSECSLYIARAITDKLHTEFKTGLVKPCIGCAEFLYYHNLGRVYYTTNKGIAEL